MNNQTFGYFGNLEKILQCEAILSILREFDPKVINKLETINPEHVEHLLDEGFLPTQVARMIDGGLRSLSENEAAQQGFKAKNASGKYTSSSGLYFPFTSEFGQLRLDKPIEQKPNKFAKYLTPIGAKSQARIPTGCRVITEGSKDAMAGSLHGKIPTGAIAGVSHYRALPQNAGYTVLFDHDGWVNANVFSNLFFAGKHLNGKVVLLPEIKGEPKAGLCEYFKAGHTPDDYRALIDSALKPEMLLIEWGKRLGKISLERQPQAVRVALRLAAQFLDEIQQGYLLENIRKSTKIQNKILQSELAKQKSKLIKRKRQEFEKQYGSETDSLNYVPTTVEDNILTTEFGNGEKDWTVLDDAFYHYSGQGYWRHISDPSICKRVAQALRSRFTIERDGKKYEFATEKHKKSAIGFCRSALTEDNLPFNRHLIAFSNGTVDMRTGELMPHDPKNLLTTAIAADYIPNAACPEIFHQFIVNVFGEELIPLIRALTSMYLDPTAPYGKFAHVIGPSGSGKGTLLRLWGSFFSQEHYRSMSSFSELGTAEGRHQYLTGTRFVTFPDVGGYISGLKAFYELVDDGEMSGRALFSSHGYQKKWNTRFAIASVDHLQIENSGDGWDRRCIPLPTKPRQGLQDPYLNQKLEEVKGEIISWALGMERAERDALLLMPPTNERIIQAKQEQSIYSDSVRAFVDMCLRPSERSEATAENHEVHDWYVAFCKAHGFSPSSITKFVSHLKTVLLQNRVERRYRREGGRLITIPAHWNYLLPVEGAFIDASSLPDQSSGFQSNTAGLTPQWICVKSRCGEGGLSAFQEFWNPSPPPLDANPNIMYSSGDNPDTGLTQGNPLTQGDTGSGARYPVSAETQSYQYLGTLTQGDTGYLRESNLENAQKNLGGGENGDEKNEISKTSTLLPCVSLCQDVESVTPQEIRVTHDTNVLPVSDPVSGDYPVSVKKDNVVTKKIQHTNLQAIDSNEEIDLCMTEENLQDIASALVDCPDPETLDLLRECWSARAMNAACKQLSPQKHDQIKQWVLALNAKAEPAQTQLLDLIQPKQASTQVHQPIDSHQYRVHSTYLGETFEPCLLLKKDASTLLFEHILTGQEILIYHTRPQLGDRWEKILNE
jgi:phage/plasmid-associated DNA primase